MKDDLVLLVVGSGGSEFAVAKKLKESPHIKTVYCAPGIVGMQTIGVETGPIEETDLDGLMDFAKSKHGDWTVVGPENVLCAGITSNFGRTGQKIFGPTHREAPLVGSNA